MNNRLLCVLCIWLIAPSVLAQSANERLNKDDLNEKDSFIYGPAGAALDVLSQASEQYFIFNKRYPKNISEWTDNNPAYLNGQYCEKNVGNYFIHCQFFETGYEFTATPVASSKAHVSWKISTGGLLTESDSAFAGSFREKQQESYADLLEESPDTLLSVLMKAEDIRVEFSAGILSSRLQKGFPGSDAIYRQIDRSLRDPSLSQVARNNLFSLLSKTATLQSEKIILDYAQKEKNLNQKNELYRYLVPMVTQTANIVWFHPELSPPLEEAWGKINHDLWNSSTIAHAIASIAAPSGVKLLISEALKEPHPAYPSKAFIAQHALINFLRYYTAIPILEKGLNQSINDHQRNLYANILQAMNGPKETKVLLEWLKTTDQDATDIINGWSHPDHTPDNGSIVLIHEAARDKSSFKNQENWQALSVVSNAYFNIWVNLPSSFKKIGKLGAHGSGQKAPPLGKRCSVDDDCDANVVDCWHWVIANNKFFDNIRSKMRSQACLNPEPLEPKPATACIDQVCVDKWNACAQNDDCTAAAINCMVSKHANWKPVNKEYVQEFEFSERKYKASVLRISCPASFDPGPKPEAQCVDNACKIIW